MSEIKNFIVKQQRSATRTGEIFYDPRNKFAKAICEFLAKKGWMKTVYEERVKVENIRNEIRVDMENLINWVNEYLHTTRTNCGDYEKILMGYDVYHQFVDQSIKTSMTIMAKFCMGEYPNKFVNIPVVFVPEIDGIVFVPKGGNK